VSVTKAVQEGVDRITIKLQPPELGRIDVRLEIGVDGRIQAVFAAERPATVEILQRDVRELERALQNAGLSTESGGLSFGLKQNGGQNAGAFAAFRQDHRAATGAPADDDPQPTWRSGRAAADGRLDIHV
jgi:flagellar hook-length control protein FliK